ncbi:hypothetical protein B0H34DRAFT_524971 [Crassisporium funariophilum]|nr:hypothetical protein B0H34DRAFT_524971 [Crassisporium funariophilum]
MSTHASFGAMLDGAAMSYVLYGIICCQVVWYYEFASLWYYLLGRGLDVEPLRFTLCTHWSLQAHSIPAEFSSFLVEGYLVLRMWKLSTRKRTAILAFAPFLVGYSFSAVYIIGLFKHQCYPESLANNSIMVVSFSLRLFTDILVTVTMCKMLYRRKSGIQSHMASLRVIRSLIMWSLTTGLLICISSTIFLTTV